MLTLAGLCALYVPIHQGWQLAGAGRISPSSQTTPLSQQQPTAQQPDESDGSNQCWPQAATTAIIQGMPAGAVSRSVRAPELRMCCAAAAFMLATCTRANGESGSYAWVTKLPATLVLFMHACNCNTWCLGPGLSLSFRPCHLPKTRDCVHATVIGPGPLNETLQSCCYPASNTILHTGIINGGFLLHEALARACAALLAAAQGQEDGRTASNPALLDSRTKSQLRSRKRPWTTALTAVSKVIM